MVLAAAMCLGRMDEIFAQDKEADSAPPTNLEVVRMLSERVGMTVGRMISGGDSTDVKLSVYPRDLAWYADLGLTRGLARQGCRVTMFDSAQHSAEFVLLRIDVEYSNIRRNGFLGTKVVTRKISESLASKLIDRKTGSIVSAQDFKEVAEDTIAVSEVESVESPNLPLLRGNLPAEGFFSNLAEPLILLGSVAVAIFLLFKVRS